MRSWEFCGTRPESVSAEVVSIPQYPMAFAYALLEYCGKRFERTPAEIDAILSECDRERCSDRVAILLEPTGLDASQFTGAAIAAVRMAFSRGHDSLASYPVTLRLSNVPLIVAATLGATVHTSHDPFLVAHYEVRSELSGKIVSTFMGDMTAERVVTDTLEAICQALAMLRDSDVPPSWWETLIPQGFLVSAVWETNLLTLRQFGLNPDSHWPTVKAVSEALKTVHPTFRFLFCVAEAEL